MEKLKSVWGSYVAAVGEHPTLAAIAILVLALVSVLF